MLNVGQFLAEKERMEGVVTQSKGAKRTITAIDKLIKQLESTADTIGLEKERTRLAKVIAEKDGAKAKITHLNALIVLYGGNLPADVGNDGDGEAQAAKPHSGPFGPTGFHHPRHACPSPGCTATPAGPNGMLRHVHQGHPR